MRRQKLFRAPRLFDQGGDLSKKWWVEIGYRDPRDGKMVRKRYQDGFSQLPTKKERYAFAEELKKNLLAKLEKGWIPPDDTSVQVVYVDDLEYHQAALAYGRKRKANKNIRFYASEYLTLQKNSKAKKTYESYRGKLREFISWLEKKKIIDNDLRTFNHDLILLFFDYLIIDRKLAAPTIEKYKVTLSSFWTYLIERKTTNENPIGKIELPEQGEDFSAIPFLDEDLQIILPVIKDEDPQLFLGAMLQYFCFIRPGDELLKLKLNNINLSARTIHVPRNIAKKRQDRTIDIPDQMYKILVEQGVHHFGKDMYLISRYGRPGKYPIGYNTLRERFNKFRSRLGMTDLYKWYSFKHTGAGKLLESGATIVEIMNQLGHTDIGSTYRYIRKHFGERSEHVRTKFPDPPGFNEITENAEIEFCI
jgi:site-specific recombinase XerD